MSKMGRHSRLLLVSFFLFAVSTAGQEPELMPPSQGIAPAIVTAESGVRKSGPGKDWSNWYRVGWGKAPKGYTFRKAEFWLTGDRTCGVRAECREVSKNDDQVLWEFRLQGNEEGLSTIEVSEGHLRIIYRPR